MRSTPSSSIPVVSDRRARAFVSRGPVTQFKREVDKSSD